MPADSYPKRLRLLTSADYQRVFDKVDYKQGGSFFTFLARSNDRKNHRLGIIASKRNLPLAVSRNRVKRLIRESFRHCQQSQELARMQDQTIDVIVLAKAASKDQSNADILRALETQWNKILAKAGKQ